jgi:hypothetical protein
VNAIFISRYLLTPWYRILFEKLIATQIVKNILLSYETRSFITMFTQARHRRKLHDDELHSLYSSPNIVRVIKSRRMRWAGHVALMGEGRGVYRVLVGKPEAKRPLGRPRHRWEDNIKLDLREIGIDGANWILMAQDMVQWRAFVNMVMNLRVP